MIIRSCYDIPSDCYYVYVTYKKLVLTTGDSFFPFGGQLFLIFSNHFFLINRQFPTFRLPQFCSVISIKLL